MTKSQDHSPIIGEEMQPCPFCATDAVHVVVDDEEWEIARVECRRINCRGSGPHVDLGEFLNVEEAREAAIDAWNLRMGHPRSPDVVTVMREALERIFKLADDNYAGLNGLDTREIWLAARAALLKVALRSWL